MCVCVCVCQPLLSGGGCGGLEETSLSEVSDDEWYAHQRDADADRGEELVDCVGQHKGAGARRQFGLDHRLTEAHLVQHRSHVESTVGNTMTQSSVHQWCGVTAECGGNHAILHSAHGSQELFLVRLAVIVMLSCSWS